ncbi:tautomerase family protein [uncultured Martelella sp.]|uniref:tautomerase family protein n=1 Tax=uncultured Martelella sp. TaxID=392331 RepID=UPI0029C8FFE6|nr:tautomerase family protein [uncultured Martelella sp.]
MPHISVKMLAGRSDVEKKRLSEALTLAVINTLGASEKSVSVSVDDIDPAEWTEKIYKTEIMGHPQSLIKKPGYQPF